MGTLPDLSAIIVAQLRLTSGEGPSMTIPRAGEVFPSGARSAGKGKKRKRGDGSGVERSTDETSDVPPSGEPQKKKKKRRTKKKSAGEQSENADEPIEQEEEDAREEELQPEEGASEAEEDSEGSPLLIRSGNEEDDDERRSPVLTSPRERTPVPIGGGAVQTGTSSRGAAILRRAPRFSFPDKVDFHYEGPAPLVYVPKKCGEFLCQLRGRAKPLPAVKDLIFGSEYEEAARAKLLGDSTMNVVIDKYDTALKGALDELELAKKEFAEKEEVSARQLNESRDNLQKLNGMMTRTVARREWRSDLPTVLPIRTKRLDIFPRDTQKQVTEAKRMSTLPDLSAIIAAQLGLTSREGPSMAVPRADEVFPSDARSAGKGKKRKRGDGSGVERSTEEMSDVPPSGEPRKKKKKRMTKKKSAGEQLENADEPIEQEEEDAREEELQPEEGASEAEASEGRNDEEGEFLQAVSFLIRDVVADRTFRTVELGSQVVGLRIELVTKNAQVFICCRGSERLLILAVQFIAQVWLHCRDVIIRGVTRAREYDFHSSPATWMFVF
ncbi:hypothetical protein F2Q69_00023231 [Brassica cretica]|uniref:Uncharacterized protein n=1 Tax=Brassica cretica TaxID=69181 RepID=A0A8S9Q3P2_BRACR|nr:hypothetical protein F2Q69_00023231 [Brassica cretica]